jgi:creatinine amidohydrolase
MPVQSAADLVEALRLFKQLVRFVTWWKDRPKDVRRDRHRKPPTMPTPWGQRPLR